jgi:hypothetical protein
VSHKSFPAKPQKLTTTNRGARLRGLLSRLAVANIASMRVRCSSSYSQRPRRDGVIVWHVDDAAFNVNIADARAHDVY